MRRASCMFSFILFALSSLPGQEKSHGPRTKSHALRQLWMLNAVYTDARHGVTFRYPSAWTPGTQFGYVPPALAQAEASDIKPIAGFGYDEGGFPRNGTPGPYAATALEGFGIVYSAVPSRGRVACDATAASLADPQKPKHEALGGHSFAVRDVGMGLMNQSNSGKLYATYFAGTCYLFETDVAEVSTAVVDDIRELTPAEARMIESNLKKIMLSVRIVTGKRHTQ